MASVSYSKMMFNKFTVALVRTTTNEQMQVHSFKRDDLLDAQGPN